ncbi:MAG: pyridoxine 5'-phosphate synthase [Saprospirales bacterium]|nr:MAG: pyridoxine 5'-phosphate synthase [Saprospirales bacterium]
MNKTKLSVNINKVALLRNSRPGEFPDLIQVAKDCESFGAEGITIHPRPDQRHIRYSDVPKLKEIVTTEFNIEGNPTREFMDLVCKYQPHQCTLVPDAPDVLTSDSGYDTIVEKEFLSEIVAELHRNNIRVSIFIDPDPKQLIGAKETGADRVELYTGNYAKDYSIDPVKAVENHTQCAAVAAEAGIGLNAGHDLNLSNLAFYKNAVPGLQEVSIGHALMADALYYGLQTTIQLYQYRLK